MKRNNITITGSIVLIMLMSACAQSASNENIAAPLDNDTFQLAAGPMAFADGDAIERKIKGNLTIGKALNEQEVAEYILYWGSDGLTTVGTALAVFPKTGSNFVHTFAAGTLLPAGVGYFIVRTKKTDGGITAGVSLKIPDRLIVTASMLSQPVDFQTSGLGYDWDMQSPEDSFAAGAATDPPNQFGTGAFFSNVLGDASTTRKYVSFRIYPPALFASGAMTVGDIQNISFMTKQKSANGIVGSIAASNRTWQLKIYTENPTALTWYKTRINAKINYYPTNDWMNNSTDTNLVFTDSLSVHDKVNDVYLPPATLGTGTGSYADMRIALGTETILFIDVIAGSSTPAPVIESYLDAVIIERTNGQRIVLDLQ